MRKPFIYLDVGGRWGLGAPWNRVAQEIQVIGFEPDAQECDRLNQKANHLQRFFPYALSDRPGRVDLFLTRARGCSSIFKPNMELLKSYPESERFEVEKTVSIQCETLDSLHQSRFFDDGADFLKLDVQGAELKVLKGGSGWLGNEILGLDVEVEFLPLYEGQPLFREVDEAVGEILGFELMDLRLAYWKRTAGVGVGSPKGQLAFGEALYFRSPAAVVAMNRKEKIFSAMLMSTTYGYFDYAFDVLSKAQESFLLSPQESVEWHEKLRRQGRNFRPFKKGNAFLSGAARAAYKMFQPSHEGWSTSGERLGSRKRLFWFD